MGYPSFNTGDVLAAADMNAVGLWRITNCTVTSVGGTAATASNGVITVGSGNSSVAIANAFSADFDNYRIIYFGGSGSTAQFIALQLTGSNTGYYFAGFGSLYASDTPVYNRTNNGSSWDAAGGSYTGGNQLDVTLYSPQKAVRTGISMAGRVDFRATGAGIVGGGGFHDVATAYTGFTLSVGGTITGGTIRVYGIRN